MHVHVAHGIVLILIHGIIPNMYVHLLHRLVGYPGLATCGICRHN